MAERGIEVDALVAKGEPSVIEVLISNGYATEHYEKWKTHPDSRVRGELARQGYCLTSLFKTKNRMFAVRWQ